MKNVSPTPPKGWNSWDSYGASVTEEEVMANAHVLSETYLKYGWEYCVVDIQWSEPTAESNEYHDYAELEMDEFSRLVPASNRFPSGFKKLGENIHNLGLKFGIHIMRGIPRQAVHKNTKLLNSEYTVRDIAHPNSICPWNTDMYGLNPNHPASQLYYDSLLEMYASWGVDLIKVDDIANSNLYGTHRDEIEMIQKAIKKTGRKIVLSLSPGPTNIESGAFIQKHANMWRLTDDFWDNWDQLRDMFDRCEKWAPFVKPGSWPDCDMLPMGRIGIRSAGGDRYTRFTQNEQRTMMSLWSIFGSPLMFGGDMRFNDEFTQSLLTNTRVIEMHDNAYERYESYRDEERIEWSAFCPKYEYRGIFNVCEGPIDLSYDPSFEIMWSNVSVDQLEAHDCILLRRKIGVKHDKDK